MYKLKKPRVLFLDVETSPIISFTWGLFDQNVALNQIHKDWHLLSFSAKWSDSKEIIYYDQRNSRRIENDKPLLKKLWKLLDDAQVVVGQNSVSFDEKKINARFILNGMKKPSPFKSIDTLRIARKHFAFTSNKLAYLADKLCEHKKSEHAKFPGFELWKQCLAGNEQAWDEMKRYNIGDILALEQLYTKLAPWADNIINFNLFHDEEDYVCNCGSTEFQKRGYSVTTTGKFRRFSCLECGHWSRGAINLFSKGKRASLRRKP